MYAPTGKDRKSDRRKVGLLAVLALTGCAGSAAIVPPLGPPPAAAGRLQVRVVYPPAQERNRFIRDGETVRADSSYVMPAVDSVFVFGSVGRGDARLTVNGRPVDVYPTGAWLAWLPRSDGPEAQFRLVAWAGADTIRGTFVARVAEPFSPPMTAPWIDNTSFSPTGDHWYRPGEGVRLGVRASAGDEVRAILQNGDTLRFHRASDQTARGRRREAARYTAWHVGRFGPNPGHVLSPNWRQPHDDPDWVTLEVIRGLDTTRVRWPLRVGVVEGPTPPMVRVDDDTAGTGATDRVLAGRPVPFGTYHWFFPNGTVAAVSGRSNSQVRLQLSRQSVSWVDGAHVIPLRPGTPPLDAVAGSMRLTEGAGSVTLRVPLSERVPFRTDETENSVILRLYGAAADMDWIRYGARDSLVRLVSFHQVAQDEVEIRVDLNQSVWGYRTRWSGAELQLEIRKPPVIDGDRVFQGRRIAIDAGHPPAGSRGATGITEAEVTLAVSRKLRVLLEEAGAEVVMTRESNAAVDLIERAELAERADAEILVSIHANALADGANPFVNSGTTVFYNHPRSIGLARDIQRALVRQFGQRDLGVARGDLHLARPTWMPAVLVEGLFMMIPEHEAVLVGEEGQWRYARGVVEGLGDFLKRRARQNR